MKFTDRPLPSALPIKPGLPPGLTSKFVVGLAIFLGGALRIVFVLKADFPYNDGGLFYTLVNELTANGFRLPAYTEYNAIHLPIVYPPLAFYLAGLIQILSGASLIEIERWIPLLFSILTIPAFAWLSSAILKNPAAAALATLAFALLPNSTDRLLMGGGLTRAPGFFFALLALAYIYRLFEAGRRKDLGLAILFSAFCVLTHPVYAWFAAYSSAVFFLLSSNKLRNLGYAPTIAAGVLLVSTPWWLNIWRIHGLKPILVAFQSRSAFSLSGLLLSFMQFMTFDLSREYFLDILGILGLAGFVLSLYERKFIWLVWLLAIFLFERTSPVALAVVPIAILVGLASSRLLTISQPIWETPNQRRFVQIAFTILVYYCLISSYLAFNAQSLSPSARQAMLWAIQNTAPHSRFLVLTANSWWDDPVSEWFPALTGRISITTVQGYEWTSPRQFTERITSYNAVRECLQATQVDCLSKWAMDRHIRFDYLLETELPTANALIIQSLSQSPDYQLVFGQPGARIFQVKPGN